MELRVHHFFDILRDFGSGKIFEPHHYGHSYHIIADTIWKNPNVKIKIVLENDNICDGCIHMVRKNCFDTISHRRDFISKEEFNNYLDRRILSVCNLKEGRILTAAEVCMKAEFYLDSIEWIYIGNDKKHTEKRKIHVIQGLINYREKHSLHD